MIFAGAACSDGASGPAGKDGALPADLSTQDLGTDVALPDSSPPDQAPLDQTIPDLAIPDQSVPDQTTPDQTVPDQLVPDMLQPDQLMPDLAIPDQLIPDQALPDQLIPDQAIPDLLVPDQQAPDFPLPTCTDKMQNGAETDVDCGGGVCPTCATGKKCSKKSDCATTYCSKGKCVPLPNNCKHVLALNSASPSGSYKIDPDGPGGTSPFMVYCDNKTAGGGWTVFMFVDSPLTSASTTSTAIDPTKLKGYHYMSHAAFKALAKAGMVVRAWGIHNTELYYECGFQSPGTSYKSWKASLSCKQRIGLIAGGYKLINAAATARGFAYASSYDAINPTNVITANSVFTKIHNSYYKTGWDMPGTSGDTYVSGPYKWYYGDWVTQAKYAMIYAIR